MHVYNIDIYVVVVLHFTDFFRLRASSESVLVARPHLWRLRFYGYDTTDRVDKMARGRTNMKIV